MASKKNLTEAAEAVTNRFFSQTVTEASETPQKDRQAVETEKVSPEHQKAVRGAKKAVSEPLKVFSFRGTVYDVDQWRLYAAIRGVKVDDIGTEAMREYLKRHPLRAEEKALFDKRIESMK